MQNRLNSLADCLYSPIFILQVLKITDLSLSINEAHEFKWSLEDHPKGTGNKVHPIAMAAFAMPLIISIVLIRC